MNRTTAVLLAVAVLAAPGCASRKEVATPRTPPPIKSDLRREIVGYQQIWAEGKGKVGYLITYEVSRGPDTPVTMFFVENPENKEMGWVGPDGNGSRYYTPQDSLVSAKRATFEEIPLPQDDLENQVRRILSLDPKAQLAFYNGR
jgi:hypothetical protein